MKNYIDIGINLTNRQFHNDRETIIQNALENEVSQMLLTGTSVKGSEESFKIAKEYPNILYSTAGIHPHEAKSMDNDSITKLRKLFPKISPTNISPTTKGIFTFLNELINNGVINANTEIIRIDSKLIISSMKPSPINIDFFSSYILSPF